MTTLVIADHDNQTLFEQTARTVTAASALGGEIHILVAGSNAKTVAAAAAAISGVQKVLLADAPHYEHRLAEPLAELVAGMAGDFSALLAPATSTMKNAMPRIAALLDVMQLSDITSVVEPGVFERPIYAGNAIQTVKSRDSKLVVTVRTSTFRCADNGGSATIETVQPAADPGLTSFLEDIRTLSERPDLSSAKVVVSGGRGLGSREHFEGIIWPLADKLGAAIGASRAAVDAGYAPNDWQVGQTGKIIAPDLYIAIGISGAIQHLAGMRDSRIIIAINKDGDAPIFDIADYGLVGDLFEIVPEFQKFI